MKIKLTKENEEICNLLALLLIKKMPELRQEDIKRLDSIAHKPDLVTNLSLEFLFLQLLHTMLKLGRYRVG